MSTFRQLVSPNTGVQTGAGWCLAFTQAVYSAPVQHATAKIASEHTKHRSTSRTMPNVSVPVWFDHWGTYGGVYGNFGHVLAWVPGRGFLSSPRWGYGQEWFQTLEEVERAYNGKFLFYSLDINTKLVAEQVSTPKPPSGGSTTSAGKRRKNRKDKDMIYIYLQDGLKKGEHRFAVVTPGVKGSWWEFTGQPSANQLANQLGAAMRVWPGPWNDLKKKWS